MPQLNLREPDEVRRPETHRGYQVCLPSARANILPSEEAILRAESWRSDQRHGMLSLQAWLNLETSYWKYRDISPRITTANVSIAVTSVVSRN